jgi:hypothetical protein
VICGSTTCGCAIQSSSLQVSGNGGEGNPYVLETNAFATVTSSTRPATPSTWQHIYETDTSRHLVWDGTYWQIIGGKFPAFNLIRRPSDGYMELATGQVPTAVGLPSEVLDTDGFHTSTNGFITIPAGLGGHYLIGGHTSRWDAQDVGYLTTVLTITSNTAILEVADVMVGGFAPIATSNNGHALSKLLLLRGGAVVTLGAFTNIAEPWNLLEASLWGHMVRHAPETG